MSSLAPLLETWFIEHLVKQRRSSPNTIAAYRDAFRLLLGFAQQQLGKPPSKLALPDLDARLIGAQGEGGDRAFDAGVEVGAVLNGRECEGLKGGAFGVR